MSFPDASPLNDQEEDFGTPRQLAASQLAVSGDLGHVSRKKIARAQTTYLSLSLPPLLSQISQSETRIPSSVFTIH